MSRSSSKKWAIVCAIIGIAAAFKILHFDSYLTLSHIKSSQQRYESFYADHHALVIAGYALLYILVTSLSLPGAAVLTLAGGAFLGLWVGTIVISFASTIGATAACSISRFLLRDWVQARFGDRLTTINNGLEKEGPLYLFTLRLIPVFPFFLINLLMGLTKIPLHTFYWVSQIGMLPATVVYVNAGTQLSKIDSLSGILSPLLILSFALIGIFPIITKKLVEFHKVKKAGDPHD